MRQFLTCSEWLDYSRRVTIEDRDIAIRVAHRMVYPCPTFSPSQREQYDANVAHARMVQSANI